MKKDKEERTVIGEYTDLFLREYSDGTYELGCYGVETGKEPAIIKIHKKAQ